VKTSLMSTGCTYIIGFNKFEKNYFSSIQLVYNVLNILFFHFALFYKVIKGIF